MDLEDMEPSERLALVALLKLVVLSDGGVSPEEVDEIQDVVDAFGEDEYQKLLDQVEERFADEAALKKFLGTVKRQDARELIYGFILETASGEALQGKEPELLGWLGKAWNVEVKVDDVDVDE
jgi:uncharacterized tellurite resistance protein B-like protein